jgi:hypothetical protein
MLNARNALKVLTRPQNAAKADKFAPDQYELDL